jgi:hypothetical protein
MKTFIICFSLLCCGAAYSQTNDVPDEPESTIEPGHIDYSTPFFQGFGFGLVVFGAGWKMRLSQRIEF